MLDKLNVKIKQEFKPSKTYQLNLLYELIMDHFRIGEIEGEELAGLAIDSLEYDGVLDLNLSWFTADTFSLHSFNDKTKQDTPL